MRMALISDIHANLEALTAVLNDIKSRNIDVIHCLGDVVGYGSNPGDCLRLVAESCDIKLIGNHEYAALGINSTDNYNEPAKIAADWTQEILTDSELALMEEYELEKVVNGVHLTHASPNEPEMFHYLLSPERALPSFQQMKEPLCFFGHTHVPMIFVETPDKLPRQKTGHDFLPDPETRYMVNVGSVGQPRDADPRAAYVVYDDDAGEVAYHRIDYDFKITQEKMQKANLPEILIERLAVGR